MNNNSAYHVMLASYTWGRDADRHGGMSDDDVINECVKDIAKIHGRTVGYVNQQLHSGVVQARILQFWDRFCNYFL
jgi:monoamine oxidase